MSPETDAAELGGKAVVVTGGGAGIGRAVVEAFGRRGASVAVVDIDGGAAEDAAAAASSAGAKTIVVEGSVADRSLPERVAREVLTAFGRLDALVNNAGIQRYGTVVDTSDEIWDEVIATDLTSVFIMSRALVPLIVESGGGAVVNVVSVQGLASAHEVAAYAAAKGGALNLTRSMAVDLAPTVRVNCVCPGSVDTPMLRNAAQLFAPDDPGGLIEGAWAGMHPMGRVARPEEVAEAVVFLASPRASFTTGSALLVDGGMLAEIR